MSLSPHSDDLAPPPSPSPQRTPSLPLFLLLSPSSSSPSPLSSPFHLLYESKPQFRCSPMHNLGVPSAVSPGLLRRGLKVVVYDRQAPPPRSSPSCLCPFTALPLRASFSPFAHIPLGGGAAGGGRKGRGRWHLLGDDK